MICSEFFIVDGLYSFMGQLLILVEYNIAEQAVFSLYFHVLKAIFI